MKVDENENVELFMCVDCAMLIANGEAPDDPATLERIIAGCDHWWDQSYVLAMGDSELDDTFSKAPCDVCGTPLAGHRLHGWAVPK